MSKKRIFGAFLIIISLIVMLLPAAEADAESSASDFTVEGGELVKYKGTEKTVTVPDTVTSIGESAFENNKSVEKVILPNSVKVIRAYAFWGCDNLKTVTLGKGLTSIDDFAFMNCTGLETMKIPSNIRRIGNQAFAECKRFEDITIPPEVTDIRENAFDGDYLLNIHCEAGSYADKYAQDFYERQKNMTVYDKTGDSEENSDRPVNAPADGVYSGADIVGSQTGQSGDSAENSGPVLGSTKIVANRAFVLMQGAGLSSQGAGGVANNTANDGENNSSGSVADVTAEEPWKIGERSHYRDENYTRATLAEDVREIGQFSYARSGLTSIVLPNGLEKINYAAFYHCDNLAEIELPESVTSVASKAFAHTAWVDSFLNGTGEQSSASAADGVSADDFLISGGVLVAYRGNASEVTVPEGVRVIAGEAFAGHDEIQKLILPSTVQNIDERAFAGCNPEEVEYLGDAMDEDFVQELVSMQTYSAVPKTTGRPFPFLWIAAAVMMLGGCVCVFQRA